MFVFSCLLLNPLDHLSGDVSGCAILPCVISEGSLVKKKSGITLNMPSLDSKPSYIKYFPEFKFKCYCLVVISNVCPFMLITMIPVIIIIMNLL